MIEVIYCRHGIPFAGCVLGETNNEWEEQKEIYKKAGCYIRKVPVIQLGHCDCDKTTPIMYGDAQLRDIAGLEETIEEKAIMLFGRNADFEHKIAGAMLSIHAFPTFMKELMYIIQGEPELKDFTGGVSLVSLIEDNVLSRCDKAQIVGIIDAAVGRELKNNDLNIRKLKAEGATTAAEHCTEEISDLIEAAVEVGSLFESASSFDFRQFDDRDEPNTY